MWKKRNKTGRIAIAVVAGVGVLVLLAALIGVTGQKPRSGDANGQLVPKGRFGIDGGGTGAQSTTVTKALPLEVGGAPAGVPAPAAPADASAGGQNEVTLAYAPSVLEPGRFLVRTGDMTVIVGKGGVPQAAAKVTALTLAFNGYIVSSQMTTAAQDERPFAVITVKVPSRAFENAISRFGELGFVDTLHTGTEDVTAQFVDLTARLKHYRSVEQRLLSFVAQAQSIDETLRLQDRIDKTQLTIEQLTGQLRAMRNQTSFGTLALTLTEKKTAIVAPVHERNSFVAAVTRSGGLILSGFETIIVAVGALLPFLVTIGVLALLALYGRRLATRPGHGHSRQPKAEQT